MDRLVYNCNLCTAACCRNMIFQGITEEEIQMIGKPIKTYHSKEAFLLDRTEGLIVLVNAYMNQFVAKINGNCPRLLNNRCTIHHKKPRHCNDFTVESEMCKKLFTPNSNQI